MKVCKNCQFLDKKYVQVSATEMGLMHVCLNEECQDPVEGTPLQAQVARGNEAFCGLAGKRFKLREVKPDVQPVGDNVIILSSESK